MITSPRLNKEDWDAINDGYDLKKKMKEHKKIFVIKLKSL